MRHQQVLTAEQKAELVLQCNTLPDGATLVLITTSQDGTQQHSTIFASPEHMMLSLYALAEALVEGAKDKPEWQAFGQFIADTVMLLTGSGVETSVDMPDSSEARH